VIASFLEHEMGAFPRGDHVLAKVDEIDRLPDAPSGCFGLGRRQRGVSVEV
jgi:hypothetical protein